MPIERYSVNALVAENITAPGYDYVPAIEEIVITDDFLPFVARL